jgi:hypothetical protein
VPRRTARIAPVPEVRLVEPRCSTPVRGRGRRAAPLGSGAFRTESPSQCPDSGHPDRHVCQPTLRPIGRVKDRDPSWLDAPRGIAVGTTSAQAAVRARDSSPTDRRGRPTGNPPPAPRARHGGPAARLVRASISRSPRTSMYGPLLLRQPDLVLHPVIGRRLTRSPAPEHAAGSSPVDVPVGDRDDDGLNGASQSGRRRQCSTSIPMNARATRRRPERDRRRCWPFSSM